MTRKFSNEKKKGGGVMNDPFIQNLPYIKEHFLPCCPRCNHNCSKYGHHHISDLLSPSEHELKFTCPSCGMRFDISATVERQEEIRKGLSALEKAKGAFRQSLYYYQVAERFINKGGPK